MIELPFVLIKQRLSSIAKLKEVDYFLFQYYQDKENFMHILPGAYVEFMPIDTESRTAKIQAGECRIRIHTVTDCLYDTGDRLISQVHDHSEIANDIYKKLQGWEGMLNDIDGVDEPEDAVVINNLERYQFIPDHRFRNILVTIQGFKGQIVDYTAHPSWIKIEAALKVICE